MRHGLAGTEHPDGRLLAAPRALGRSQHDGAAAVRANAAMKLRERVGDHAGIRDIVDRDRLPVERFGIQRRVVPRRDRDLGGANDSPAGVCAAEYAHSHRLPGGDGEAEQDPIGGTAGDLEVLVALELLLQPFEGLGRAVVLQAEGDLGVTLLPDAQAVAPGDLVESWKRRSAPTTTATGRGRPAAVLRPTVR